MADVRIPTLSGPDVGPYVQRTVLDGTPYLLAFRWNARAEVWTLSISNEQGELACGPISLRNWMPLLRQYRSVEGVPPGEMLAVAYSEPQRDAGHEELGTRVVLYYREALA